MVNPEPKPVTGIVRASDASLPSKIHPDNQARRSPLKTGSMRESTGHMRETLSLKQLLKKDTSSQKSGSTGPFKRSNERDRESMLASSFKTPSSLIGNANQKTMGYSPCHAYEQTPATLGHFSPRKTVQTKLIHGSL